MPRNRNNSTFDFRQDQPRLNHPVDHLKQMLDIPEDVEEKFRALTSVRKFRKGERITASSDIRFFGFLCKYAKARSLRKGEWITVTAEIRWEHADVYEDEGVVLYARSVEKAETPEDPLVYFR